MYFNNILRNQSLNYLWSSRSWIAVKIIPWKSSPRFCSYFNVVLLVVKFSVSLKLNILILLFTRGESPFDPCHNLPLPYFYKNDYSWAWSIKIKAACTSEILSVLLWCFQGHSVFKSSFQPHILLYSHHIACLN